MHLLHNQNTGCPAIIKNVKSSILLQRLRHTSVNVMPEKYQTLEHLDVGFLNYRFSIRKAYSNIFQILPFPPSPLLVPRA